MKRNPWCIRFLSVFLLFVLWIPLAGERTGSAAWGAERGALISIEDFTVAPVLRNEVERLVDAGTIQTDGYKEMVLSLGGEVGEFPEANGKIGVILIPNQHPFDKALEYLGVLGFPIEISSTIRSQGPLIFASDQMAVRIAFPSYRVLMYNTTNKTARVWFYAYRTQ